MANGKEGLGQSEAYESLSEKDKLSIDILRAVNESRWYRQVIDVDKKAEMQFYYPDGESVLGSNVKSFLEKDFLRAVDFYYANRDSELAVTLALNRTDGMIKVFEPAVQPEIERRALISIQNFKLAPMLETAYLIVRSKQQRK